MTLFDPSDVATDDTSPLQQRRLCDWCHEPIPSSARSDAITCSQRCRQARHRFMAGATIRPAAITPLRLCYADPPYPEKAGYYVGHPDFAGEVDHTRLVEQLTDEYPDGWALSTSAHALRDVLAVCPSSVRVAAWFRGERPTVHNRPLNAWEPVIFDGGRPLPSPVDARRIDALVYHSRPRLTDPRRVVGSKPASFCYWIFELLGALPGDELVDLFPGSGGVARAWRYVTDASRLAAAEHDASRLAGEARRLDLSLGDDEDGSVAEYSRDVFEKLRQGHHLDDESVVELLETGRGVACGG